VQALSLLVEEFHSPLVPHQLLGEVPFPFPLEPRPLMQAMAAMFQLPLLLEEQMVLEDLFF
jgi:hypothetical protein